MHQEASLISASKSLYSFEKWGNTKLRDFILMRLHKIHRRKMSDFRDQESSFKYHQSLYVFFISPFSLLRDFLWINLNLTPDILVSVYSQFNGCLLFLSCNWKLKSWISNYALSHINYFRSSHQGCSIKKMLVKILQYSQEINCVGVSF